MSSNHPLVVPNRTPDLSTIGHVNYPHFAGRLPGCPLCDTRCACEPTDTGTTECAYEGAHTITVPAVCPDCGGAYVMTTGGVFVCECTRTDGFETLAPVDIVTEWDETWSVDPAGRLVTLTVDSTECDACLTGHGDHVGDGA
jgi:hypothetical protein